MRVIEPKKSTVKAKDTRKKPFLYSAAAAFMAIAVSLILLFLNYEKLDAPAENNFQNQNTELEKNKPQKIKQFSPDEFRDLYNSFAHPNTEIINEETPISGNVKADARIRKLAEARGYKLRSAPVSDAFANLSDSNKLQHPAAMGWSKLSSSAKKDGINLRITEALRSAEDQKAIFLSRLGSISITSIAQGTADTLVGKVLEKTAPPGYSRHHSGYTIDLACDNQPSVRFEDSNCFEWLSENNYLNAKKNGWIPSYPEGTKMQGPEPESWEYVWIGVDSLSE